MAHCGPSHHLSEKGGSILYLLMSSQIASSEKAAKAAGKGKGSGKQASGAKRRTEAERKTPPKTAAVEDDGEVRWNQLTLKAVACSPLCWLVALGRTPP